MSQSGKPARSDRTRRTSRSQPAALAGLLVADGTWTGSAGRKRRLRARDRTAAWRVGRPEHEMTTMESGKDLAFSARFACRRAEHFGNL